METKAGFRTYHFLNILAADTGILNGVMVI
jgi:hypothetical protein